MNLPVLRKNHHVPRRAIEPTWDDGTVDVQPRSGASWAPSRGTWDRLSELDELHRQMNGIMGDLFDRSNTQTPWTTTGWRPAADVEETPDAYLVEIDLPAVKRDDVEIEVGPGELVVTGEIKERERVGFLRTRTRRTGQFDYRVALPIDADPDHVTASLTDGVLSVRVPQTEHAKRRKVTLGG